MGYFYRTSPTLLAASHSNSQTPPPPNLAQSPSLPHGDVLEHPDAEDLRPDNAKNLPQPLGLTHRTQKDCTSLMMSGTLPELWVVLYRGSAPVSKGSSGTTATLHYPGSQTSAVRYRRSHAALWRPTLELGLFHL
ncbi:hypothetical protein PIB30_041073 [Stylosanthes scabra]|uniref:Uncharacterized protein n=1 Tax=Stylosanthes scabra TaxID=79078 RepID=A0ABU6WFX7_9FABA|nr:hypothetical protein [Stylosanthes scabra]